MRATRSGAITQTDKLYTGQQKEPGDSALGLYNYKARFYSATLGRFLSADSLADDGLNRFSYGANNPQRFTDPSGHCVHIPGTDRIAECTESSTELFIRCAFANGVCGGSSEFERSMRILSIWAITRGSFYLAVSDMAVRSAAYASRIKDIRVYTGGNGIGTEQFVATSFTNIYSFEDDAERGSVGGLARARVLSFSYLDTTVAFDITWLQGDDPSRYSFRTEFKQAGADTLEVAVRAGDGEGIIASGLPSLFGASPSGIRVRLSLRVNRAELHRPLFGNFSFIQTEQDFEFGLYDDAWTHVERGSTSRAGMATFLSQGLR